MHIKELYRLAKMANTDAKVSIRMTDEDVTVRWYAMPNHPASFSRSLPWSALGEERGPEYLAVKEYLRMSAFYMAAFGGRHDRTSELFVNKPPLLKGKHSALLPNTALRSPRPRSQILTLKTAQLLPGDEVRTAGTPFSQTVARLEECHFGYFIRWKGGMIDRFGSDHEHQVFRRGQHG